MNLLTCLCSEASGIFPGLWDSSQASEVQGSLEVGLSKWKVELLAALEVGASEVQSMILKVSLVLKLFHLSNMATFLFSGLQCVSLARVVE